MRSTTTPPPTAGRQSPGNPQQQRSSTRPRRNYQACIACKEQKIRCQLGSPDDPQPPCARCRRSRLDCVFGPPRGAVRGTKRKRARGIDDDRAWLIFFFFFFGLSGELTSIQPAPKAISGRAEIPPPVTCRRWVCMLPRRVLMRRMAALPCQMRRVGTGIGLFRCISATPPPLQPRSATATSPVCWMHQPLRTNCARGTCRTGVVSSCAERAGSVPLKPSSSYNGIFLRCSFRFVFASDQCCPATSSGCSPCSRCSTSRPKILRAVQP